MQKPLKEMDGLMSGCVASETLSQLVADMPGVTDAVCTPCALGTLGESGTVDASDTAAEPVDFMLIRRFNAGEICAFEVLVTKYQRRVASLINRTVRNSAVAEELTQETFLRAYRALSAFRFESAFSTWLYTIGRNIAVSYYREGQQLADNAVPLDPLADEAQHWEQIARLGHAPSPEEDLANLQLLEAIEQSIAHLSPQMRASITLREMEECSYASISEQLGIPLNTVRSLIFRARATIAIEIRPLLDRAISER